MVVLKRRPQGDKKDLTHEDWPLYYQYKDEHPDLKYADDVDD